MPELVQTELFDKELMTRKQPTQELKNESLPEIAGYYMNYELQFFLIVFFIEIMSEF